MDPIKRSSHNFTYKGPEPGIGDLSCEKTTDNTGRPVCVSHWRPNDLELQALIAGGAVRLSIFSEPIPPVALGVSQP